jgi:hypothetical protein
MKSVIILFIAIVNIYGQVYSEKDVDICKNKFALAVEKGLKDKEIATVISQIGRSFIGTDYVGFAIEKEGDEQLVIDLSGLDCTTFLENSLVLGRLVKKDATTFEDYQKELTFIRYRGGVIDKYPSRLHYFSDWISDNRKKGVVKDVTKEIGGEKINFNLFFMSKNNNLYKHLKENPAFVQVIRAQEEEINKRDYYYIPKEKVAKAESFIKDGDLIACVTNLKGLDIGHVGIAVKEGNGRIHFMHAPQEGSKVEVSRDPLPIYLSKVKKHTGIIVLRPQEP